MTPERLAHLLTLCENLAKRTWSFETALIWSDEARTALPEALARIQELEARVRELEGKV
jgi:hypothetical protein